ncbi:MAG: aminopeptidase P family protein [Paludibacteraceae bacterium]|nr:aminopeptidase P family protein [Paludibacteraceae bacterium]
MKETVAESLCALRRKMRERNVDALVVPTSDPHGSEMVGARWKMREHYSGFTGSAGTLAVLSEKAALWTDSRYYIQAREELSGSGIVLMKSGESDTPDLMQWIRRETEEGAVVNLPGSLFPIAECQDAQRALRGRVADFSDGLAEEAWADRPAETAGSAYVYGEEYAGKSAKEKTAKVRSAMKRMGIDTLIVSRLDEVSWLCNLRGNDIRYTPVVTGYVIVEERRTRLYIAPGAHEGNSEAEDYLKANGIETMPYDEFFDGLGQLAGRKILLDKDRDSHAIYRAVGEKNRVFFGRSPIGLAKSIKNETEIRNVRRAMEKDGRAMVRFWKWMEETLERGESLTEMRLGERLREFRAEDPDFIEESFAPIVGYGPHGAIVHYSATEETDRKIGRGGLLLIDSGGHYLQGTTDITRTFVSGEASEEAKHDYTLVLKGHIALARAVFPPGTTGKQLDILAKQYLWKEGKTYGHGTGHGVGHLLCVHEGPQNISPRGSAALSRGMITSNEPGYYVEGAYGIRHENLTLTVGVNDEAADQEMFTKEEKAEGNASFLRFETLTLCPFDVNGIEFALLDRAEREWIDRYHEMVWRRLSPLLEEGEAAWLRKKTQPIGE